MEEKRNNATEKVENIAREEGYENVGEALTKEQRLFKQTEEKREQDAYARMRYKENMKAEKERAARYKQAVKERATDEKRGWSDGQGYDGRQGDKSGGKKKAGAGWIIAVVALGVTTLVMGTLLIMSTSGTIGENKQMTGAVDGAYYDLVNFVDAMDVDMSKLIVSNDKKQQQKILVGLSAKAQLAAKDISGLPIKDESKFYTTKFVNQVGDYSKYLNNKLIDGLSITEEDKDNLKSLYRINGELKKELTDLTADMGADYDFKTLIDDNADDLVTGKFDELESNAVDYPKLIYDGPFSDALDEKSPKGLEGKDLSLAVVTEKLKDDLKAYGITNVTPDGEGQGVIKTYNFVCKTEDEGKMYVETSKAGGKIVMFECYRDCTEQRVSLNQAEQIADKFLKNMGFDNMKAVWATEKGAVAYLNYVYTIDGVAVYPDMVKLTVCKERGVVSSMDAREYYLNHTERTLEEATITADQAKMRVNENIKQQTCRKAIVPYGENKEVLTYEISGTCDGATYYVYIDAADGKEIQIFRVIETTEGKLLI